MAKYELKRPDGNKGRIARIKAVDKNGRNRRLYPVGTTQQRLGRMLKKTDPFGTNPNGNYSKVNDYANSYLRRDGNGYVASSIPNRNMARGRGDAGMHADYKGERNRHTARNTARAARNGGMSVRHAKTHLMASHNIHVMVDPFKD